MVKKILSLLIIFSLLSGAINAQEDNKGKYYLPYDLSSVSTLKFNTFLMNPALPLLGKEESNISLYHREQWFGFQNNYVSYGLAYGKKWSETNAVNAMLYKHDFGVMTNYGLLANYGHYVEISDQIGLRLGLNLVLGMSGVDKSKILLPQSGSPNILDNASNVIMINTMPGFDMNFGNFHIGAVAENIFDYAISSGEMAVPFAKKSFMVHMMYRHELLSMSDLLEDGILSVMAQGRKTANTINFSGSVLLDLPAVGWGYLGYGQNYGVFAGLGFNVSSHLSIGVGYEQGIVAKIPNLGGSYQAQINYQFGGQRHERDRILKEKLALKKKEKETKRRSEDRQANKPPKEEKTVVGKPQKPVTPSVVAKKEEQQKPIDKRSVLQEYEDRIGTRRAQIIDEKVSTGYYVVIGVYRDARNAYRLIQEMRKNGFDVYGFLNPANNMTYVNIGGAQPTPHKAEKIMMDNIYNKAFDGIWILKISR